MRVGGDIRLVCPSIVVRFYPHPENLLLNIVFVSLCELATNSRKLFASLLQEFDGNQIFSDGIGCGKTCVKYLTPIS